MVIKWICPSGPLGWIASRQVGSIARCSCNPGTLHLVPSQCACVADRYGSETVFQYSLNLPFLQVRRSFHLEVIINHHHSAKSLKPTRRVASKGRRLHLTTFSTLFSSKVLWITRIWLFLGELWVTTTHYSNFTEFLSKKSYFQL